MPHDQRPRVEELESLGRQLDSLLSTMNILIGQTQIMHQQVAALLASERTPPNPDVVRRIFRVEKDNRPTSHFMEPRDAKIQGQAASRTDYAESGEGQPSGTRGVNTRHPEPSQQQREGGEGLRSTSDAQQSGVRNSSDSEQERTGGSRQRRDRGSAAGASQGESRRRS